MNNGLSLFSIFHLNLMYSSIRLKDRPEVVDKCYWPLLELIDSPGIPVGIELSGYTLEQIKAIDRNWIKKAGALISKNKLEIIGSGYSQIIGPLVPAEVNIYNQEFGNEVYRQILGYAPTIALVNEQAYSSGLIPLYKKTGYKALIMEWDNPYRFHQEWDKRWRYYPQMAYDGHGNSIPIIWNNAIAFQKFQRYAHGEIEIDEYSDYLRSHLDTEDRTLSMYGNDAEIFDFRPGRFQTEAKIQKGGEWNRIKKLFKDLKEDKRFNFILPSQTLKFLKHPSSGNELRLESAQQPIPVKKQGKYNITRWAVTGRDNVGINTKCWQFYNYLKNCEIGNRNKKKINSLWKKLCFLWSSDFRTHIEKKRWIEFKKELNSAVKEIREPSKAKTLMFKNPAQDRGKTSFLEPTVKYANRKIEVETKNLKVVLSCDKGLTLISLLFKDVYSKPLIGTIAHGYYDDIRFGADYFTGHTIIEESGKRKITDLERVEPIISKKYEMTKGYISIKCLIKNRLGSIIKEVLVYVLENKVELAYYFDIHLHVLTSIRTGIVTFFPESFEKENLYYKTVNGGDGAEEKFNINNNAIKHSLPIDKLISASHCIGATEGWLEVGDENKYVRISTDKTKMYSVPMIEYENVADTYFLRCLNSVRESDETSISNNRVKGRIDFSIIAGKR